MKSAFRFHRKSRASSSTLKPDMNHDERRKMIKSFILFAAFLSHVYTLALTNKTHCSISTRIFGCNPAQQYYKERSRLSRWIMQQVPLVSCSDFLFCHLSFLSACVRRLIFVINIMFSSCLSQHPSLFDMAGWFFDFTAPSYTTASSALSWAVMRKICMRFHAALHDGCYCSLGDCLNKMNNDRSSCMERRAADKMIRSKKICWQERRQR